jgi:enamine deaminase RidA (YjgF/YER057c/UK114 family)
MTRRLISTGSPFEEKAGYSRAVVAGDWCFVSGTTGYDYATMQMPADAGEQASNIFNTITATLEDAGFALQDIVRATYHVTETAHCDAVMRVASRFLGDVRPAATMVISGLIRPEMKVEIEVTAFRG